jgi:hypothetical protein
MTNAVTYEHIVRLTTERRLHLDKKPTTFSLSFKGTCACRYSLRQDGPEHRRPDRSCFFHRPDQPRQRRRIHGAVKPKIPSVGQAKFYRN